MERPTLLYQKGKVKGKIFKSLLSETMLNVVGCSPGEYPLPYMGYIGICRCLRFDVLDP